MLAFVCIHVIQCFYSSIIFSNFVLFSPEFDSKAFCLLLRMLTIRMTSHQMDLTLKHADSPYIRATGFLYLRYAGPPEEMWKWIEPYLQDEEEIQVEQRAAGGRMTMGEFVRRLFAQRDYYGTPLPRLPLKVERDLQVKLLQAEDIAERAKMNFKNGARMAHFQKLGSSVMALYGDDENPVQWYEGVVDRVITRDEETGIQLKYPKFVVTFPEYGNTEIVTLGEMDTLDGNWKHDRLGDTRGGVRDRYEEVRRRERDTVTADRGWARRPPSTKQSLSQSTRGRSHPHDDDRRHRPPREHRRDAPARPVESKAPPPVQASQQKKRSPEEMAAIAEKKRKLLAKYG